MLILKWSCTEFERCLRKVAQYVIEQWWRSSSQLDQSYISKNNRNNDQNNHDNKNTKISHYKSNLILVTKKDCAQIPLAKGSSFSWFHVSENGSPNSFHLPDAWIVFFFIFQTLLFRRLNCDSVSCESKRSCYTIGIPCMGSRKHSIGLVNPYSRLQYPRF